MLTAKRIIGIVSVIIFGVYMLVANYDRFYKAAVGAARLSILTMSFENAAGAVSSARLKAQQSSDKKEMPPEIVKQSVTESKSSEKNDNASAVETVTNGRVLGGVVEKTFSTKSSNTCFDDVNIDNKTGEAIDIGRLLSSKIGYKIEKNGQPQVLIYHTHTTEGFLLHNGRQYTDADKPRTNNTSENIVAVGEIIADCIAKAGYRVVHDKTLHDYPAYSGSYTRSAQTVKKYLNKYPSIKVIIDLHRDAVASGKSDKIAPIAEINGKKAAQVMLVMGSGTGTVKGHEKWQENLKLAVRLQQRLQRQYPLLARSMLLKSNRYNQDLSTGALLIEIGTDANTLEQAKYSGEMVGTAICEVFADLS